MKQTFKVIIAGSREFNDSVLLTRVCDHYLSNKKDVEVVSGNAKGADRLGERFAQLRGYKLTKFPADWNKYGKKAGYLRNKQMSEYADALIALWDGRSRGTKMMIDLARQNNLQVKVVEYGAIT